MVGLREEMLMSVLASSRGKPAPTGTVQTPKFAQYPLPQEHHKPQSLHSTCGSGLAREEARTDLKKLRRDAA